MEKYDSTKYPSPGKEHKQNHWMKRENRNMADKNMYELTFTNKGGLVMPIIIEWTYKDGTKEIERIPAQVWRKNEKKVTKTFVKDKEVASVKLDPIGKQRMLMKAIILMAISNRQANSKYSNRNRM